MSFCPSCGEEARYDVIFCEWCGAPVSASIVETRLAGVFTGWTGDTTFTFENGERWRQAGPGVLACQLDRPRAWIYPSGSGHALRIDGLEEQVQIDRAAERPADHPSTG